MKTLSVYEVNEIQGDNISVKIAYQHESGLEIRFTVIQFEGRLYMPNELTDEIYMPNELTDEIRSDIQHMFASAEGPLDETSVCEID